MAHLCDGANLGWVTVITKATQSVKGPWGSYPNIQILASYRSPRKSVHVEKNTWFKGRLRKGLLFSSVAQSGLTLWPHGLQHVRPPCPSPTPRVYSNSCSLSRWCHPAISSSVIPFFSLLQSFPASGSFQMSQFFPSCGQSIRVSVLASVLPMNIQDWFPLGWTGWISLQSKELSRVFSSTTVQKHQFFTCIHLKYCCCLVTKSWLTLLRLLGL